MKEDAFVVDGLVHAESASRVPLYIHFFLLEMLLDKKSLLQPCSLD